MTRTATRIVLLGTLALAGCQTAPLIPAWQGKLYRGDSRTRAAVRQSKGVITESIPSDSPGFDGLRCMTGEDLRRFWQAYVLGCKEWYGDRVLMPEAGAPAPAAVQAPSGDPASP